MKSSSFTIIGVIFIAGCYDPNYMQYQYPAPPPSGEEIAEAPPAPMAEVIPPVPYSDAIWVDGYWDWTGDRYFWITGRYMRAPRVGVAWYPGGYVRSHRGYVHVRGRWAPPGYRSNYRYVHSRAYRYPGGRPYYRHPGQPRYDNSRYGHPQYNSRGYAPPRGYRGSPPARYAPGRGDPGVPAEHSYQRKNQTYQPSYSAPSNVRRSAPPAGDAPSKVRKSAPPVH